MKSDGIVSPADGKIIYIKRIDSGEIPISVKNGRKATLSEFANTGILDYPCWLIGINMTPFDVHRNCAPVDGRIILNRHYDGEFLSLKHQDALARNERNTIVIENPKGKIGVVQTASRLVRRIVTYKSEGESVSKGEWFGMIKFGSQVDLIIPAYCKVNVNLKQQVYAMNTLMAEW
jgi:phosphatidylserine decarboxylase